MTPKLTPEQREALQRNYGPVPVEDDQRHSGYYLVNASTMSGLERQETWLRSTTALRTWKPVVSMEDIENSVHALLHSPSNE